MAHPLPGSPRRYVLGDRFHNSTNPHKSPLCKFHDINLCLQSCVLKTNYQESENHRKNTRRLRSSCVQGFGTHYFYNYLMDHYQNADIVRKQRILIEKNLEKGQSILRTIYFDLKSAIPKAHSEYCHSDLSSVYGGTLILWYNNSRGKLELKKLYAWVVTCNFPSLHQSCQEYTETTLLFGSKREC